MQSSNKISVRDFHVNLLFKILLFFTTNECKVSAY
jgi:hypothetical protein